MPTTSDTPVLAAVPDRAILPMQLLIDFSLTKNTVPDVLDMNSENAAAISVNSIPLGFTFVLLSTLMTAVLYIVFIPSCVDTDNLQKPGRFNDKSAAIKVYSSGISLFVSSFFFVLANDITSNLSHCLIFCLVWRDHHRALKTLCS